MDGCTYLPIASIAENKPGTLESDGFYYHLVKQSVKVEEAIACCPTIPPVGQFRLSVVRSMDTLGVLNRINNVENGGESSNGYKQFPLY